MQAEIERIRANIEAVKHRAGITRDITIVAATKTVEPERINELPAFGITIAGENRVQELLEKYDRVKGLEWHFIGALQTNKVKYIIDKVTLIHSVDRVALADEIDRQAARRSMTADVLVEVNTGSEPTKSGVLPGDAESLLDYVAGKKNIRLRGVMGVFPVGAGDELYERLAEISRLAGERYGADILSAGMSGDYEKAILYGANVVRLGSAIFGKRTY